MVSTILLFIISILFGCLLWHLNDDTVCLICRRKFNLNENPVWVGYDIDSLSAICKKCYKSLE